MKMVLERLDAQQKMIVLKTLPEHAHIDERTLMIAKLRTGGT